MSGRRLIDDLVKAERARPPRPPEGEARKGWHRLQHSIGIGAPPSADAPAPGASTGTAAAGAAGKTASAVATKWIVVAIATSTVGGVMAARSMVDRPDGSPSTVAASTTGIRDDARAERAPSGVPRPAVTDVASASEPEPAPSAAAEPAPPIPAATTPRRRPSRAADHEPPRAQSVPDTPVAPRVAEVETPNALDPELALIREAQRALARGDSEAALRALERHALEFEAAHLVEDRSALRVLALCASGDGEHGSSERDAFLRKWPRSIHAVRVRAACEETE